jgi:3-isopropylmalate dehydrogenase
MKKTIAVLAGDGIGPEAMTEAMKILELIAMKFGHEFSLQPALIGGAAYEQFGHHFPEETKTICEQSDAILFGSVGGPISEMEQPKWKGCEKNSILGLRKTFNFNANYRPVKMYPELAKISPLRADIIGKGIDILIIRELVGDLYFGEHKTETINGIRKATDVMEYDEQQIRSIAYAAFKAAQLRGKKVTSVDKSNVLDCSKLWKEVVIEVHQEYPDITLEHILVDNCAMQLIRNPRQFDVLLCPNMFGDILSDEAAVIPGSLGLMPSASLSEKGFGLYEPAGGSAPDIAGKNIANPIAQILSAAMLLRHSFALETEAQTIEQAVAKTIAAGHRTADIAGPGTRSISTTEMGQAIRDLL